MKIYLTALAVFFSIDMVWLGLVAKNFYQNQIGSLLKTDVNWVAAISFYLLFVAALTFFVIKPALAEGSVLKALMLGAFFGLVTYATYDLTNLATLKNWPLLVTIVDLIWGTTLGATVSATTTLLAQKFGL